MAEGKRQNAAAKVPVATPNIGPSGIVSMETALSGAIGARIRLTTNLPSTPTLEGTLFTACPVTNLLALSTSTSTFHILPFPSIQSFTLLSLATSTTPSPTTPTTPLPLSTLQARLANSLSAAKLADSRRAPKNAGKDGQEIFDALSRTLQTRWEGTSIVVLDAVEIRMPWRVGDCRIGDGKGKEALARVKKVLEFERKKLAEKPGGGGGNNGNNNNRAAPVVPAAVPMGGPRKGG